MSFRAKLLTLFVVLGVVPIIGLGILGHVRSIQSVEDLIRGRTSAIAERVASEIRDAYALRESSLLLFAENAETQRLYRAYASGDSTLYTVAWAAANEYLREAWDVLGSAYYSIEYRDSVGSRIYALGETRRSGLGEAEVPMGDFRGVYSVTHPVLDTESGVGQGEIVAVMRLRELLPQEGLEASFGREGYSLVVDRSTARILYHPRRVFLRRPLSELLGPRAWNVDREVLESTRGSFNYTEDDASRIASFVSLSAPQWTVLSSASMDEFGASFARTRAINLILVLVVAALISVAFLMVTGRMTRSLAELTLAADQVAIGNFTPSLPAAGSDEIGRLAGAFAIMARQVSEMLRRIQESRHMAAVGRFASQLSHEIRNPLTSVKLNLQRLERGVEEGRIPDDYAEPVDICLGEVRRLERVVRGALSMARTDPSRRVICSVHEGVEGALQVLNTQLEGQRIRVETAFEATGDYVSGDEEQLKGVFLNLLLNAADAMPDGGRIRVSTETGDGLAGARSGVIRVRVADEGSGVSPELREKIFEPFFSTKEEGTGFGLALAQQVVEEHHGRLELEHGDNGNGAVFLVEFPLVGTAAPGFAPRPQPDIPVT